MKSSVEKTGVGSEVGPQAVVRPLSSEHGPGAHNGPRVGPDSLERLGSGDTFSAISAPNQDQISTTLQPSEHTQILHKFVQ